MKPIGNKTALFYALNLINGRITNNLLIGRWPSIWFYKLMAASAGLSDKILMLHALRLIAAFNLLVFCSCLNSCTQKKDITAQFTYSAGSGGEVVFTNQSTNASSFSWNYGDGSPVDVSSPAIHTFKNNGTFTVTLTAFGEDGVNTTISQRIIIANAIAGRFTFNKDQYGGITYITHDTWQASNVDVFINDNSTSTTYLRVNNMPHQSSGTYTINNGHEVEKAGALNVDVAIKGGNNFFSSVSGSLIKTSTNSFKLTCTVSQRGSSIHHNVTASGTYRLPT